MKEIAQPMHAIGKQIMHGLSLPLRTQMKLNDTIGALIDEAPKDKRNTRVNRYRSLQDLIKRGSTADIRAAMVDTPPAAGAPGEEREGKGAAKSVLQSPWVMVFLVVLVVIFITLTRAAASLSAPPRKGVDATAAEGGRRAEEHLEMLKTKDEGAVQSARERGDIHVCIPSLGNAKVALLTCARCLGLASDALRLHVHIFPFDSRVRSGEGVSTTDRMRPGDPKTFVNEEDLESMLDAHGLSLLRDHVSIRGRQSRPLAWNDVQASMVDALASSRTLARAAVFLYPGVGLAEGWDVVVDEDLAWMEGADGDASAVLSECARPKKTSSSHVRDSRSMFPTFTVKRAVASKPMSLQFKTEWNVVTQVHSRPMRMAVPHSSVLIVRWDLLDKVRQALQPWRSLTSRYRGSEVLLGFQLHQAGVRVYAPSMRVTDQTTTTARVNSKPVPFVSLMGSPFKPGVGDATVGRAAAVLVGTAGRTAWAKDVLGLDLLRGLPNVRGVLGVPKAPPVSDASRPAWEQDVIVKYGGTSAFFAKVDKLLRGRKALPVPDLAM